MKKSNLLLLTAFAGILFVTSCKKKDEPAPAPAPTNSGNFTVGGEVQTPTTFTKTGFSAGFPYPFTIIEVKNAKYLLEFNFNKFPLVDGEYTIGLSTKDGMVADLEIEDLTTGNSAAIFEGQTSKIKVAGNRITFTGMNTSLNGKSIALAADLTVVK